MSDLPFTSPWTAPLVSRQGIAYVQDGTNGQWHAFDTVSQQLVGTLPNLGTPIAATAGNELAFFNGTSVMTVGTSGAVTGGGPLTWDSGLAYWTNSGYHLSNGGLVGAVLGPELWDETFFAGTGGNREAQGQERKPTMATFRVVDQVSLPGDSLTAVQAQAAFNRDVPNNEMKFSVGMQFFDLDLIKLREPSLGPQWFGVRGPAFSHRIARLKSQVGIVFVGSCYVGVDFENLFDYTLTGPQALIVPKYQGLTDLKAASNAWLEIAKRLAQCETVDDAVLHYNGLPVTTEPLEYRVVGNGTIKLGTCPASVP
jgi:hypothetical protein